ncbi:hypothetical protein SAMN05428949_4101 [Chitinophaga sp. YR627]|uniref:Uncharacterized protein n=1 Tax=Chitinophaga pinensis TaxID=79329 RepID=A0A5C6LPF8_9BACT|nr:MULTISPECIES: hypothetical protein [Chitinophaga]TWV97492.1 hypothetical protein FEF09_21830 [Chitinophaga pinensis]SFO00301.1 hypothetical protein SAMN05428949_4101 [Chitinophaga sp. YR627]
MITVRAFKAPDDPEACLRFYNGHLRLLEIYFGIAKITSGSADWMHHDNSIVIIVEDETRTKTYGGARVQLADGVLPLPIETAIGKYDAKIYDAIRPGSAEICAMWNSKEVAGMGIGSQVLARAGVVLAAQLPIDNFHVLCAPITTRIGKRVGFVIDESLGDKGTFFYPKDDFIATAMLINDVKKLEYADPKERELIYDLRENLVQTKTEVGPKGSYEVSYNLEIPNLQFSDVKSER